MNEADDVDIERPVLGLSNAEAAEIMGMQEVSVARLVVMGKIPKAVRYQRNGLDREVIERMSLDRYKPGHLYWIKEWEVAEILGVSRRRVSQLREAGRLPVVDYQGRHFYRRPQIEVLANARETRRLR